MTPASSKRTAHAPLVAVTIGKSGFASQVRVRNHSLWADEPRTVGGTDSGPSPYELLLASLGTCVAMTVRMYADRKGWPLAGVSVSLSQERIRAEDCLDCESASGPVLQITKRIELQGDLDQEQRSRIMEIADRCPVQRSLVSEVQIRTE